MMSTVFTRFGAGLLVLGVWSSAVSQSITVTQPTSDLVVAEGKDYPTYRLANRWDMRCPDWAGLEAYPGDPTWDEHFTCDLVISDSKCVDDQAFAGGVFSGTSTNTCNAANVSDPNLILVSPGPVAGVGLSNGRLYPISTSDYRYFTVKIRFPDAPGNQATMVFFQTSADANDPFGRVGFVTAPGDGGWHTITFDMIEDANIGGNATLRWDDQSEVIGFRFDPTTNDAVRFEIDWMRLTGDPQAVDAPDSSVNLAWSADGVGGSSFDINAIASDGTSYLLESGLADSARDATVDLSRLAPGVYDLEVSAGGVSALAPGAVEINHAPELRLINPDKAGDESRDYALDQLSDPWGPMNPADIITATSGQTNLLNIDYVNGDLIADAPTGGVSPGDPRVTFTTSTPIDSNEYRMLSYQYELEVQENQIGSVARLHWGTAGGDFPTPDTVSDDILVERGMNTYVLGDMRNVPDKDGVVGVWNGDLTVMRFDPHEVDDTRQVTISNFRIRPLDTADPTFTIRWEVADANSGDPIALDLYLDPDKIPFNGNESLIMGGVDALATSSLTWDSSGVAGGEYFILGTADDGHNAVSRYAGGKLRIIENEVDLDLIFADRFEIQGTR